VICLVSRTYISDPGITAAALDPVTTTLADVQTCLLTWMESSTILLGSNSIKSDLHVVKLSHLRCIDTALIFHARRGQPLKPGLAWFTPKWLGYIIQVRGTCGCNHKEGARAYIDTLKAKIKNGASLIIPPL
jgi:RNA exonuclease 1